MFYHAAGITIVVLYLIYSLSAVFLTLLEPTDPYSLSREELEDADLKGPQLIPKVIHQVYLGWDDLSMPEHWKAPQQSCLDLHPDYEYKVNPSAPSSCCVIINNEPALGQRNRGGIARIILSLVFVNMAQLQIPHPARGLDPLFHPRSIRGSLHRP